MRQYPGLDCILLVDDDDATNFLHRFAIERTGVKARLEVATNGREAIDLLARLATKGAERSGLILLDINMPLMNGWEFLEVYRDLPMETRAQYVVIMLTTSLNPDDERKAKEYTGMVADFIRKPLVGERFEQVVQAYFGKAVA